MPITYRILNHSTDPGSEIETFKRDVRIGLAGSPKRIPSRYFYDANGSQLFEQIMELPEYYLTRAEYSILEKHKAALTEQMGSGSFNLVELGAGDGHKTRVLLDHFAREHKTVRYVPIDISEAAMATLQQKLRTCCPELDMVGLVGEYFEGLNWLEEEIGGRSIVLFLGSNIGNLDTRQARVFLSRLREVLNQSDLVLIGFDLKKEIKRLNAAYNDSSGVTKRFNLNLLKRLNRELNADFDLSKWRFYSAYNALIGGIESALISEGKQAVHIGAINQTIHFDGWEAIHTEYSLKYTESQVEAMARRAGFKVISHFYDAHHDFLDSLWQVEK